MSLSIWKALAGIAVFLLGMDFLEQALKQLAGRSFKIFLRKQSSRKLSAISSAALVTGVLQSSSIVNLMILTLVGANIVGMQHALALMLGTNLGTTLSTWFVATVGFKLNIESYTLPIIGLAGAFKMLTPKNSSVYQWSNFCLGLGFIFAGLDWMKTGIGNIVANIDFHTLPEYPAIVFLIIGFFVTALIQSSSATNAIVLSALHAQAISLYSATAVVLGAEIGTTMKLLLASANGSPVKKRVAVGNVLYNSTGVLLIGLLLKPVNTLITGVIGIKDPLIALSFFQTFVNLLGIFLFFPFLDAFGRLLERLFKTKTNHTLYIGSVPPDDVELALTALEKECLHFIRCVIYFSLRVFDLNANNKTLWRDIPELFHKMPRMEQYNYLKQQHGDIYAYCIQLQKNTATQEEAKGLNRLTSAARNAMFAAKGLKDAFPDIDQLKNSANEAKYSFYIRSKDKLEAVCIQLAGILEHSNTLTFEDIIDLYQSTHKSYTSVLNELYKEDNTRKLEDIEVSTIINFNRELYTSFKSIVLAAKDCLLIEKDAAYFDELPGFIH